MLKELDYYKETLKKLYESIKKINIEILKFNHADWKDWKSLTDLQKRALILSNVERIDISYEKDKISIKYTENTKKQE
ncbi:MAG: hypothetical protein EOM50_05255 [Erysipelotrichia bacterium]|nr:hypothetical protein [Erysipelotrichia bacterium]